MTESRSGTFFLIILSLILSYQPYTPKRDDAPPSVGESTSVVPEGTVSVKLADDWEVTRLGPGSVFGEMALLRRNVYCERVGVD